MVSLLITTVLCSGLFVNVLPALLGAGNFVGEPVSPLTQLLRSLTTLRALDSGSSRCCRCSGFFSTNFVIVCFDFTFLFFWDGNHFAVLGACWSAAVFSNVVKKKDDSVFLSKKCPDSLLPTST
jgi:hypothetical protein